MPCSIPVSSFRKPLIATLCLLGVASAAWAQNRPVPKPNILWLTCEDMSPHLGCYGEPAVRTPHIDRLAREGVRYTHAFSTSGVCAPSRSCLITGVYPSSLGTQFMRCKGTLPDFVRTYPDYLRQGGYYCTNNAKTDYNFDTPTSPWDESSRTAHWQNRPAVKPFFAVFNNEVTHESQYRKRGDEFEKLVTGLARERRHDPATVKLPPYYPETPEARLDWAQYLDVIEVMDQWVGEHLARLEQQGLADDTIVFFYSDHGVGLPRAKRWLYDSGTHVPLIVRFGKNFQHYAPAAAGEATGRMVSFIDFAPTVLSLADIRVPTHMQGIPFLGMQPSPAREFTFGIRDRMDEWNDVIRSVRERRFHYIRNYMPHVTYAQPLQYAELGPTLQSMRKLFADGKLEGPPSQFFRATKPAEELYDTETDPHELVNLADAPEHRATLERLRRRHEAWMRETLDLGLIPEPDLHARCGTKAPYVVVRQPDSPFPLERIRQAAVVAQKGREALAELVRLLDDSDPAVRCWGATGAATLFKAGPHMTSSGRLRSESSPLPPAERDVAVAALRKQLADDSPTVRIAAARALLQGRDDSPALETLTRELSSEHDWVRHHAALGLADLGPRAVPARELLERALADKNEYVVWVATAALKGIAGAAGGR